MDEFVATAFNQPLSSPAAGDVWETGGPLLGPALEHDVGGPFLEALEEVARNAALTGSSDVQSLLDGLAEGCQALRRVLAAGGDRRAREVLPRLTSLEREAGASIAAGYASGLEETIDRLRHQNEECSPFDPHSGAMRVSETLARLGLEVERCRRMALSLGVLGLALGGAEGTSRAGCEPDLPHVVAAALAENVRRYDGVGQTADGDFLVVFPDVSRRALSSIAERLRREVSVGLGRATPCFFALAHYDYVDVSADEMMTAVEQRVTAARAEHESLGWV